MLCVAACLLAAFFSAEVDAIVARETVAMPEIGTAGEKAGGDEGSDAEMSRPAASRRTPSLMAAFAVGIIEDTADAGVRADPPFTVVDRMGVSGDEYARSMPRLTILSHFRFSSASSVSCTVS